MGSSEFLKSFTTSLKVRAPWQALGFQASFKHSRADLRSGGILSAHTAAVQSTLVMACAFLFCRVSLTRHCSQGELETEACGVPHWSFWFT